MLIDVITIFPGMLKGFLEESILRRAALKGIVEFRTINLRDFTRDAHRTTDDRCYGGGPGMVMIPEPIFRAVESVRTGASRVILMTPQGRPFDQAMAAALARERHLIFVCGHYEGVDERVREHLVTDEISIGDYVLTNGVLPAAVVIDAVARLLDGAIENPDATKEESFGSGKLEYPQYTRPADYRGMKVPEVLLSGDHARIAAWRMEQSETRTRKRRPDLLARAFHAPA
ncbi:MAG: tRNA (guanosine(37)-N1)-methyltransferase TrmD [Verrucomicrobiota bacterium]|nr:tRNA (guanosine(37)-N1)-methyltransferase TrmD [Verrucomicrobiota bacterium]